MINFELSPLQIKQIASSIDLKDVKEYVENHKEEYEQFLKEEQEKNGQKSTNKQYTHFKTVSKVYHQNIQKTYDTTTSIIWNIKNNKRNGDKRTRNNT